MPSAPAADEGRGHIFMKMIYAGLLWIRLPTHIVYGDIDDLITYIHR